MCVHVCICVCLLTTKSTHVNAHAHNCITENMVFIFEKLLHLMSFMKMFVFHVAFSLKPNH